MQWLSNFVTFTVSGMTKIVKIHNFEKIIINFLTLFIFAKNSGIAHL